MDEERIYVIAVAKGGAKLEFVTTISELVKKYKKILSLETIRKMRQHGASIQEFGNETWLKSLTVAELG